MDPLFEGETISYSYENGRPDPPEAFVKLISDYYYSDNDHDETTKEFIKNVLDIGCGPGNSTKILHQSLPLANIVGLDLSKSQIDTAAKKYANHPNISFLQGDANDSLPCESGSVQLITCVLSIHWLNLSKFFEHCDRVLCRGGVLAALIHNDPIIKLTKGPQDASDQLQQSFHKLWKTVLDTVADSTNIKRIDEDYRNLQLPYSDKRQWRNLPEMFVKWEISVAQIIHFINSLGSLHLYLRQNPGNGIKTDFLRGLHVLMEQNQFAENDKVITFEVQYQMYACKKN